jgi:hypothetical protein
MKLTLLLLSLAITSTLAQAESEIHIKTVRELELHDRGAGYNNYIREEKGNVICFLRMNENNKLPSSIEIATIKADSLYKITKIKKEAVRGVNFRRLALTSLQLTSENSYPISIRCTNQISLFQSAISHAPTVEFILDLFSNTIEEVKN